MRRTLLIVVGLFAGALLSVASARAAGPVEDRQLADAAWPTLSAEQKALVELVAEDRFNAVRGGNRHRYEALPRALKATYRGQALPSLGVTPQRSARRWI